MKRHVLIYGLIGGILIAALKWSEYRFLVIEHSFEIYGGLVAATFAILGIWLGLRLNQRRQNAVVQETPISTPEPFAPDQNERERLGITRRELEILKHIATGGMGAVYRARDTEDGREVALKVLTPDVAAKPAMLVRFKREAEHAKKLNHENIVGVYDCQQYGCS